MIDRTRWDKKYTHEIHTANVNENLMRYAPLLQRGWVLDLAGGPGQNGAWLEAQADGFRVVDADISEVALGRASREIGRVNADAGALPFRPNTFDTILNFRFYDPRIIFAEWLAPGGTVLFETFTQADAKYRPEFNPAHRFRLDEVPRVFGRLELERVDETDNGRRIYITILARKPERRA